MLKMMFQSRVERKTIPSRLGLFLALPALIMVVGCSGGSEGNDESSSGNGMASETQASSSNPVKKNPNKLLFLQCAACHATEAGAPAKVGPNLNCVIDRPAGALTDFKYSDAFKEAASKGLTWDAENLSAFIANSKAVIPNNTMAFNGIPDEEKRLKIIDYLSSQCGENNE